MSATPSLTRSPAWLALQAHQPAMAAHHVCDLFAQDPQRFERFSLKFNDILLDYSKHPVSQQTIRLLLDLAEQQHLHTWITRLFEGEKVNDTEHRAALHTALRGEQPVTSGSTDVMPEVRRVLAKMEVFSDKVRNGG
ncbi:hypothetical protein B566_EDAN018811, partial [Ephemera danica]